MLKRGLWLSILLLQAACPGGEGRSESEIAAEPETPNIVLVTIDTLRADYVSAYGGPAGLTPNLDRLADEGVLFETAVSPVPITLPAHASLFTGTLPPTHGVRDNSGFVLHPDHQTLAEILAAGDFQTGAFVGAFVLDSRFGLDQGFEVYVDNFPEAPLDQPQLDISERRADEVVREAQAWIRARSRSRPWFAWVHLFDPHAPYQPPPGFQSNLGDYAGEVSFVDAQLGRFFQFLRDRGEFDRSLIVVTSDHGEGLGEHGEDTHGMFLYDSTLRVPLIIRPAGGLAAGRRYSSQVRLIDVMPTILAEVQLDEPKAVQGRPLQPSWNRQIFPPAPAYAETLLPLLNYGWSDLAAVRTDDYKYIRAPKPELFALNEDPAEQENLYTDSTKREPVRELSGTLEALQNDAGSAAAAGSFRQPDEATLRRLRSLGYAGSNRPSGAPVEDWIEALRTTGQRPDPKDKIEVFNAIWRAQGKAQRGDYAEAAEILSRVLADDPDIFIAHSVRAVALLELDRVREALSNLREAARLRPEDPGAHLYLGLAQQRLGEVDAAVTSFRQAWSLDPELTAARNNLAAMLARQQRFSEAATVFEGMVREQPDDLAARLNLGGAYLMLERLDEALEQLRFVERRRPDIPELQNNLGLLFLNQGDLATAENHLKQALTLRPDYPAAHRNLAEVYRRQGRTAESARHLEAARRGGER